MKKNRDKNKKIIEIKYDLADEKGKYLDTINKKKNFQKRIKSK